MAQKPESRLQKKIVERLRAEGAYADKTHGSKFKRGLPDVVFCYKGVFGGLEVKTPENKSGLTELQRRTLLRIKRAGGVAGEVRSVNGALRALQIAQKRSQS
jgi:hypothetical protein